MRSGETIRVKTIFKTEVDINEVVIYPHLNGQKTLFWKVEGMFGSYRFTLGLTRDKKEACELFDALNRQLLEVHEKDLRERQNA